MRKKLSLVLVFVMLVSIFAGCGSKATSSGGKSSKSIVASLASYPDTIDPALNSSVDGGSYIIHTFSGLVGYEQKEDGTLELVAEVAKELPTANTLSDGSIEYVFELKDNLKWSDGSELTAKDFVYAWNRAADPTTGADYGYMFEVVAGYEEVAAADDAGVRTNPDAKLNVTASEDGKKLTVVLPVDLPYFFELCAFPAYMPVKESVVAGNDAWATDAKTYIGNGPYKVVEFTQSQLVLEKNEYYHSKDKVTSDKLVFAFNADDTSLLANFQNGAYNFIDSVPNDEIKSLQEKYPEEFNVMGQLGTYYVSFNVNDETLSAFTEPEKVKIRKALGLMIDRNYIADEIGQSGQVPANGFVSMGLTEPDGTEYIANNGVNRDGNGYFNVAKDEYTANTNEAIQLLKEVADSSKLFTVDAAGKVSSEFPKLTYITNPTSLHEAVATYLQATFAQYGVTLNIEQQEWGTFLNTRKQGSYSIARNGWLADYNDPISFLDMWVTSSGNNDSRFGKDEHASYAGYTYNNEGNKTWAESYDKIIAAVKASKDPTERFKLMHEAEDLLMSTGAICPIFYYTDTYMCSKDIDGFFASPLGFKYFMYATVK